MSRFFSLLLLCLDAQTDDMEMPDWRFFGAMPQYEARWSWSGKSSIRIAITSSEAVLGPIPGTVSRHAYVPSSASSPAMASSMRDASSFASLIRLASVMTCGFSAFMRYSDGLVEASAADRASFIRALLAPLVAAPRDALPASATPKGPPSFSSMDSQPASERSASASNAGQDSSSMLRRRFLSLVAQVTRWSRCDASDLAASSLSSGSAIGSSASGTPRAVLAMTKASRSSVFTSPANSFAA